MNKQKRKIKINQSIKEQEIQNETNKQRKDRRR